MVFTREHNLLMKEFYFRNGKDENCDWFCHVQLWCSFGKTSVHHGYKLRRTISEIVFIHNRYIMRS
jgi:hypothetical protein